MRRLLQHADRLSCTLAPCQYLGLGFKVYRVIAFWLASVDASCIAWPHGKCHWPSLSDGCSKNLLAFKVYKQEGETVATSYSCFPVLPCSIQSLGRIHLSFRLSVFLSLYRLKDKASKMCPLSLSNCTRARARDHQIHSSEDFPHIWTLISHRPRPVVISMFNYNLRPIIYKYMDMFQC